MTSHALETALAELERLVGPLLDAGTGPEAARALLSSVGFEVPAVPSQFLEVLVDAARASSIALEGLPKALDDLSGVEAVASQLAQAITDVRGLLEVGSGAQLGLPAAAGKEMLDRLAGYLVFRYLEQRVPTLLAALRVLGVVETRASPVILSEAGTVALRPLSLPAVSLELVGGFLTDPVDALRNRYAPMAVLTSADAKTVSDRVAPDLTGLLLLLGVDAAYGQEALYSAVHLESGGPEERERTLTVADPDGRFRVDAAVVTGPGGVGLKVMPSGVLAAEAWFGLWLGSVEVDGELPALIIRRDTLEVVGSASAGVWLRFTKPRDGGEPAVVVGPRSGTRLELGILRADCFLQSEGANFGLGFSALQSAVVLAGGDGDGFLNKLLPGDGIRAEFEFGISWSRVDGLMVSGAVGLEVDVPLGVTIGGGLNLDSVFLGARVDASEFRLSVGLTLTVRLGPLTAAVRRVGLQGGYEWGQNGGGGVKFLPPTGAGLSIDAGVTGGGFLEFDDDNKRYAGILALKFGEIGITAIGLITTRMPDGSDGFSMLISLGITFDPPIQLSFGFTLSGVGGLVGVNRTMLTDVLQKGVKDRTLDSILFPDPEWVIPNAAKVISDLRSVFPPAEGRFVVGPMVQIGWGTPNLIVADIGVFLELPAPIKIVLLGQLSMKLPKPKDPIVQINLNIVGVLDFEKKELSFQASLYDSGILKFELFGDSAFFLSWGAQPQFALSIGGFHPKFDVPPPPIVFAGMKRMGLNLSAGSNFQLTCTSYQALTPNSLQFGAQVDLYAKVGPAEVTGYLGFDTLIYFSPFSFDVTIRAGVTVKFKGKTLADVRVQLDFSGPTPWKVNGVARAKIFGFKVKAKVRKTWGRSKKARLPAEDPWPMLQESLERPESWSAKLPSNAHRVASFRGLEEEQSGQDPPLIVHPTGALEVLQNVAPLDCTLEKFGAAAIAGHDRFRIDRMSTPTEELEVRPIDEFFARGQFEKLSTSQRLSAPAFEKMPGGVTTVSSDRTVVQTEITTSTTDGGMVYLTRAVEVGYESILVDANLVSSKSAKPQAATSNWAATRARAAGLAGRRAGIRGTGTQRFAPRTPVMVGTVEDAYVIVDTTALLPVPLGESVAVPAKSRRELDDTGYLRFPTKMQADRALNDLLRLQPELTGELIVVPEYEVAA